MSSWKKAAKVNQKTHRERHQPDGRSHLGLLEKKKDYRQRSKDFHSKQARLKSLKKKALSRNPDEFYFHMVNSKVQDGVHNEIDKEDEHTPGQIRLMQTQDLKYVRLKCKIESSKIERMQSQLHLIDVANQTSNKHVFFVDTKEEAKNFDVAARLDTHPALISRRTNRPKLSDLQTMRLPCIDEVTVKSLANERNARYKEMKKRVEREKELTIIQQKLEIKRHLQNKKEQPPVRIKPGTKEVPPVYKWKLERKK